MQAESERRLFDHADLDFNVQPSLKDLEFLDQEAERVVHRQVGSRYDPEYTSRPAKQDFDIPAGKRGERSGLHQVLNDNRARTPQLCPQEYLRLEHVRDPIKYDDLDLRLFVSGELNIIDRDDILQPEWRGRLNLLKHILYLAGYYEWRGCLQLHATIINQIELGIKSWSSDFSEERALVLLPYAQPNRRERPQATQPVRRNQNQNRNSDTPDSRVWFCRPYQKGDCNKPESHRAFVQGRGPVTVQHICAKCYLTDKTKSSHPENSDSCPNKWLVPAPGHCTVAPDPACLPPRQGPDTPDSSADIQTVAAAQENLVTFMVTANNKVKKSGQPNFKGCRIPVPSLFKFDYLKRELADYDDSEILLLLRYGCPINFEGVPETLSHACKNHKGAIEFPEQVDAFLRRELAAGSVMGPFIASPFDTETIVSPLNTVPKKDSAERRVIVDLSFPKHSPDCSINGGIKKDAYLGDPIQLRYPLVDNLVNLVREKGPGCFLFKCDLSRAYRQLPVDPGDLHYLGYKWRGELFIDVKLTMGLRSAAYLCQRVTNAIAFIAKKHGVSVSNYLDDFGGVEVREAAPAAFLKLREIIGECGAVEAIQKACTPGPRMVFLGILINTEKMVQEVSPDRLQELHKLLQCWLVKSSASKKQTQSLIWVLQFVAICVKPGRVFMSRLLNFLGIARNWGRSQSRMRWRQM